MGIKSNEMDRNPLIQSFFIESSRGGRRNPENIRTMLTNSACNSQNRTTATNQDLYAEVHGYQEKI